MSRKLSDLVWNPVILLTGCVTHVDLTEEEDPPPPLKRQTPDGANTSNEDDIIEHVSIILRGIINCICKDEDAAAPVVDIDDSLEAHFNDIMGNVSDGDLSNLDDTDISFILGPEEYISDFDEDTITDDVVLPPMN